MGKKVLTLAERVIFGGKLAEQELSKLLGLHYKSRFRREWLWSQEAPHFFSHRIGFFDFVYGEASGGPYPYYRGFFVSELLQNNDKLLDIGCGDGFFTKRFYAKRCSLVDAIDIEADAIDAARSMNAASNINYHLLDAVQQPFPSKFYDIVVWDGALGHFAPDTTHTMLEKIVRVLSKNGVFAGSESLGPEGHDHLQFFETIEDIDSLFAKHFAYRAYRTIEYDTAFNVGLLRREAFWRCSSSPLRIAEAGWTIIQG
jgi:ubiquinone/menaquinone biosynthesis C-methylase UbiE